MSRVCSSKPSAAMSTRMSHSCSSMSASPSASPISGFTVLIAMAGMFLTGNKVFTAIAVGTMLVVAVAVAGSLTVLPALLSKLGDNLDTRSGQSPGLVALRG